MIVKTSLKVIAVILITIASYAGAVQYWAWKWETPSKALPAGHLTFNESFSEEASGNLWAESAQVKMTELATQLQSVSMSGAMTVDGNLAWVGSVGLARVEPLEEATATTQYRIGSVSKALTAVAMMRMVEEGLLDLDVPIQTYLPDYPQHDADITLRQLASHMSGIRHYGFDIRRFPPTDSVSNEHYVDAIAALEQFKGDDLLFTPGQGFNYSTHGYTLLSAVMQAAGGKRFEALVADLVTQPLGTTSTQAESELQSTKLLAGFYSSDGGLYGETPEQNLSNKVAGGGFVSTPMDLVKLGRALLSEQLLKPESFTEMTTVQPMYDGSENQQGYALGWRHYETRHILDEDNQVDVIHHGGRSFGADTFLLLVPEYNIAVAITTNGQSEESRGEIQMLAYELAGMVIRERMAGD
ncbi:serine hydrolase domain-containing protein [Alteromonas sp. ASW11-36]|uniref:Serine hydrolase domain-containing protein n=1 Tax=Alteromonas arenosi TaxID=3055817 RepID=A0ABT7SYK3_9ALTE|nr:serine hydrolase domain-containing protein [Alteromonas sp. ASW11-36]MDM7861263.1 serine hydrolase domain-containing protein [Alteromonas sp. ASW11-36]